MFGCIVVLAGNILVLAGNILVLVGNILVLVGNILVLVACTMSVPIKGRLGSENKGARLPDPWLQATAFR